MKIKLVFVFLHITLVSFSQSNKNILFEEGSKICFVGNSITQGGSFHHNIMLYQMTRYPKERVTFYNCGIGGNQAHNILDRMESDILVHNPTHAVIMLGMNDVRNYLYGTDLTEDQDTLKLQREAISKYKNHMDSIVNIFLSKNIKVILQKPSIYDQTATIPAVNHFGANDALKECADFNGQLASKYDLPVIDYWSVMDRINKEIQKEDPAATIIGKDRVHPGETGQFIMAYQFLKDLDAPAYISKMILKKDKNTRKSMNCTFENIDAEMPGSLSFRVTEKAIPFPFSEDQSEGIKLVPFNEEFNIQLLKLKGLKRGQYQVVIDDVIIGSFSSKQLRKGINLTEFENTPQYRQSRKVLDTLQELWELEGILRDLKFVEFTPYYKRYKGDENDLDEFHEFFVEEITKSDYKAYLEYVLKIYMKNKPMQEEYEDDIIRLRNEAYQLSQPLPHKFEIIRMKS